MMSVLHLTYDMRIGGTEMVIKNIIQGLHGTAYQMSIFCIEAPLGPWGEELQADGIRVDSYERRPGFDWSLIQAIRQHLKQHQIDVIHCHQYTPWIYGVLAALGLHTKVVFTEHGRFYPDVKSWKRALINPWLCRITDKIVSISDATKQALQDFENIKCNRIETLYNGIEPLAVQAEDVAALRESLGILEQTKVLGTVARLDPIKNHAMMLTAFAAVLEQEPNCLLLIVGDGEERDNLQRQIAELGLEEKVLLPGYIANPKHYIALTDVFLLSSLSEGTSMTLLEAMSLGKPCVVTDAGGNAEVIKAEYNGVVTQNDNAGEFAQGILKLLKNSDLYESYANHAKKRFNEQFDKEIMNKRYAQIYQMIGHAR